MSNRISFEGGIGSSSLQDLNDDLDLIYQTYVSKHHSSSNDTLDSEENRAPPPIAPRSKRLIPQEMLERLEQDPTLPIHISSRLSSLKNSNENIIQSAPQTPKSSSSFDFNPHKPQAMSNSSVNILDTPTIEENFRDIVSPQENIGKSTEALKSLNLDEDDDEMDGPGEDSNAEDWRDKGAAVKKVNNESTGAFTVIRRSVQDFEFGKQLGEGSYSTVVLGTDKITSTHYAIKILDKRHIIKEKKVKYVNIEKHALNRLSNRVGVVSLYFTFQDKDSLYFVLDYASNGELLSLIKKYNTLNEECVRYFGAQILDAIDYMHSNGVIHRDIKPENILLDDKLRIQITDFGTAKLLEKNGESNDYPVDVRAKSFVGTAEYVSPELLENKYCGKPGDVWAFGCIVYQMIAGKPPFKAQNEYLTFQKITKLQYAFSAGFPMVIRDLIKQILVLQPSKRATIPEIQKHYFFRDIDFSDSDQIWMTEHPELGPYKMSAKSMMKLPELHKSTSTQSVPKRPAKKPQNGKRVASEPVSNSGNRPVNPASAAAFVLNKNDSDPDITESTDNSPPESLSKAGSRANSSGPSPTAPASRTASSSSQPDYIPGTNILRPTIIHSYSRTSSSIHKKPAKTILKSKVIEVTPVTPIETAWKQYLKHPDERILKIGAVIANKVATEHFEKKHRGFIHESPLGFLNKNRSNSSFLSQVVSGNGVSLRKEGVSDETEEATVADESKAIRDYFLIEEAPPSSQVADTSTIGSKSSKFLKRLGISNREKSSAHDPVSQHPLEKPRTCTMFVTTLGRVLIFFRSDSEADYRLISEIRLSYPFIQFKEVVSNNSSSKILRMLPSTGMFAVVSSSSTFTFEVEKFDTSSWTESLAKAQLNQYERVKAEKLEKQESSKPSSTSRKVQSPKLLDSPRFGRSSSPAATGVNHSLHTERPIDTKPKRESLLNSKLHSRGSVKRKPPPPMKSTVGGIDMSTGLAGSHDSGTLHAAQLAVSNISHAPTNNRRSSFTKEDKRPTSKPIRSSPAGAINTLNSKFLARSQRNK